MDAIKFFIYLVYVVLIILVQLKLNENEKCFLCN